jgi:transposase
MSQRETQLPDLDTLDVQSLKALVLAKQAELDSRTTEIESLKLLIVKLKRMHFGPSSEKYERDLQQLELRLEDLEANQAAAEPPPAVPADHRLGLPREDGPHRTLTLNVGGTNDRSAAVPAVALRLPR